MKMTSGVRLNERRKRALERLLEQKPKTFVNFETGEPDPKRAEQWAERREAEIAVLKKRTGQLFS